MADVAAKREAKQKEKEEERKKKNEEIKANKAKLAAERQQAADKEAEEAAAKEAAQNDLDNKRAENVKKRETASTAKTTKPSSKYSKKEVYELKKVFDEYDKDRSGSIDADEFKKELEAKKKANAPRPGQKSTLAQRQSQEGVSLVDLSGSVFDQMDKDGDGSVTFEELIKLMFKNARKDEIQLMLSWVEPEPEPEPEPKPEMSAEAIKSIKSIFKLYDKDKSGSLTIKELKIALTNSGVDPEEVAAMVKEFDVDKSGEIEIKEFLKLMESTGAFDDM